MSDHPIRVVTVDDHPFVREGIRHVVNDAGDMTFAGEAADGQQALTLLRSCAADVVLLDISMPGRSGFDLLAQIRKEFPGLKVLMLSMHEEQQFAVRALKCGAAGFLSKHIHPGELLAAVRHVVSGRKYITPTLAEALAQLAGDGDNPAPHELLSNREFETLIKLASGKRPVDIASELSLSIKTVSQYRTRLLAKMKLWHNGELMHYAITHGLIDCAPAA